MKTFPRLPDPLLRWLGRGAPALLVTVGSDGWGHTAMTWAVAASAERVRFGVDLGSTTLTNLQRDGKASLQVIGPDDLLALIKGRARMVRDRLASFPMALWQMDVTEVKDQSWSGVTVLPLTYRWVGPQADSLRRREEHVLVELRGEV